MNWFTRKRVLPRWKLMMLIIIGIWIGLMVVTEPVFAIILGMGMVWEVMKKSSD